MLTTMHSDNVEGAQDPEENEDASRGASKEPEDWQVLGEQPSEILIIIVIFGHWLRCRCCAWSCCWRCSRSCSRSRSFLCLRSLLSLLNFHDLLLLGLTVL